MGSSKKHKEKDRDREHKRKRKHRSRSKSKDRKEKHKKHRRRGDENDHHNEKVDALPIEKEVFDYQHQHVPENIDISERYTDEPNLVNDDPYLYERGGDRREMGQNDARHDRREMGQNDARHDRREMGQNDARHDRREMGQNDARHVQLHAANSASGEDMSSLSIDNVNKLRSKLGLKPLDVKSDNDGGVSEVKPEDEFVHVPAKNIRETRKVEVMREKFESTKEKRRVNEKLKKIKTLGESDSEDDLKQWVQKSRKMAKEKILAEKRAKVLEEMDQEFGLDDLVKEEFGDKKKEYSAKHLKGLEVQHNLKSFKEGRSVILTLKDKGVLDEEEFDTLVNVNMIDDEKYEKNIENKKKKKTYNPYDDEEFDTEGNPVQKITLSKYDEVIDGEKKKAFTIGSFKEVSDDKSNIDIIRSQLSSHRQTLYVPALTLASEYYSTNEMESFRKVTKKVRKIRKKPKMLKADDLLNDIVDNESSENREKAVDKFLYGETIGDNEDADGKEDMDVDEKDDGPVEDLSGVPFEEDLAEIELQSILNKTRKLKQKKEPSILKVLEKVRSKNRDEDSDVAGDQGDVMLLNATSEFCKNLGEIPTYGLAGNREEERDEIMDIELEIMEQKRKEQEEGATGWEEVDIDDRPVNIVNQESASIAEEPLVNAGIGTALELAVIKGYLTGEQVKPASGLKNSTLEALNYSIEDKRYEDLDDKYKKRDRYQGALSDFKEKEFYRPDIKIDYVDDLGRDMSSKEAFRYLSHRFHGKGSGKKKTEKRSKKADEVNLMNTMSSTDTPLNTLALLKEKQKAEKTPYVLLSGTKGMHSTNLTKTQ